MIAHSSIVVASWKLDELSLLYNLVNHLKEKEKAKQTL